MKIAIITQPLGRNYGGILQNYALQYILKELGHIPLTVHTGRLTTTVWLCQVFKHILKRLVGRNSIKPESPFVIRKRTLGLNSFINKRIALTEPVRECSCTIIRKYNIDAIIVGSDQVWRPKYSNLEEAFLGFTDGLVIKRVAYAASFGTDHWEFSESMTARYSILAKKFDAISVREDSAVPLCNKYFGVQAVHVLDPTLLVPTSVYKQLAESPGREKRYLLVYLLDELRECDKAFITKIAENRDLCIVFRKGENYICESDTVEGWLGDFKDADYVVTDSFHGTVFSIIFNRDFAVIPNSKRGNARIESLLRSFDLNDRIIDTNRIDVTIPIPWDSVNMRRKELTQYAYSFLKEVLFNA